MSGLFSFLRVAPQSHPQLGSLEHARGRWHGVISLHAGMRVALHLPGSRSGPESQALAVAQRIPRQWEQAKPAIERGLFDHYTAGRDAGIPEIPDLSAPASVWPHVTISSIQVERSGAPWEFQAAIRTAWDDEHTLGARVREGQLVELNGSILEAR